MSEAHCADSVDVRTLPEVRTLAEVEGDGVGGGSGQLARKQDSDEIAGVQDPDEGMGRLVTRLKENGTSLELLEGWVCVRRPAGRGITFRGPHGERCADGNNPLTHTPHKVHKVD